MPRSLFLAGVGVLAAAPSLVAAVPWSGAKETIVPHAVADWSPVPTEFAALNPFQELARRQADEGGNTCGYISGSYSQSLTCNNNDYVCATNSFYGVHGCCNPSSFDACTLPTTCIPSSLLSQSCTGSCLGNNFIAKCTNALSPACYNWLYVYPSTTMTEWGCYLTAFTEIVQRTWSIGPVSKDTNIPNPGPETTSTPTPSSTQSSTSTSASSSPTQPPPKKSTPVGAIAGGVVGGLAVLGIAAAGLIFLFLRSRKNKKTPPPVVPGQAEYKPPTGMPPTGMPPQDPNYPQPGYGQQPYPPQDPNYPPQGYMQQPGNTASYYAPGTPGQDVKHAYMLPGQPGHSPGGETPSGVYSAPTSPSPQYANLQPQHGHPMPPPQGGAMELGSTPIPGHPGHQIYEAPSGRE